MKVKLSTEELKNRLSQLGAVIAKKANLPVYGHVRLVASPREGALGFDVWLSGVDIDASLSVTLPKAEVTEPVDVLVPFAKLVELVGAHTVAELVLDIQDETKAVLRGGKASAILKTHPVTNWPTIMDRPETPIATLSLGGLKRHIDNTAFAIPAQESKFTAAVALLESKGKVLRMVATDGYRMAISELPTDAADFNLIVPKTALDHISKLEGETVTILAADAGFYFETADSILTVSRSHGAFPAYENIIPKTHVAQIIVDQSQILAGVRRTRPLGDPEKPVITFSADANGVAVALVASFQEAEQNFRAVAQDEIDVAATGVAVRFSLDAKILQPFLEKVAGKIVISLSGGPKGVVLFSASEGQYRYLQMPFAVND